MVNTNKGGTTMVGATTPGPWQWREVGTSERCPGFMYRFRLGAGNVRIGVMDMVSEADASLIAAAPDLLAACEAIVAARYGGLGSVIVAMDLAEKALAKAKGEAS